MARRILGLCFGFWLLATAGSATTLVRQSLDRLVTTHQTILVGEVLEAVSYWNAAGTFILTDVRIGVTERLKGPASDKILTVTLMGGSVGELTTVIVGGAELEVGRTYLLFLNPEDLPGVRQALTVREHVQGAFDLRVDRDGRWVAQSQAIRHPLQPDERRLTAPVGGVDGMPLDRLLRSIRTLERLHGDDREVH